MERKMAAIMQAPDDLRLLGYVQYMALTAQTDAARQIFKAYLENERRLLQTPGGHGLRVGGSPDIGAPSLSDKMELQPEAEQEGGRGV